MTSGEEDDLACSFKTVIHRPTPHFYLPTRDSQVLSAPSIPPTTLALTPSPLMPVPPPLSVLVLPSPSPAPVNVPIHHRAHTDPDLLFYNQPGPPIFYAANWYPPYPPGFVYGPMPPPPAPPFTMHQIPFRSSSVDCRRTVNNAHEPHVIHPERVW
jgi:hypothetical protein